MDNIARLNNALFRSSPRCRRRASVARWRRESFVGDSASRCYAPLDQYLEEHFAGRLSPRGAREKAIVAALAKLVRPLSFSSVFAIATCTYAHLS